MEQPSNQDLLSDSLSVNGTVSSNLLSAANWGRFIAISLLIVFSLAVIFIVIGGTTAADQMAAFVPMPGFGDQIASVIMTVIALVLLLAGLLLFISLRAYNHLKAGIETRNMDDFTKGWRYLKIYFAIYGVLTLFSILTMVQSITTIF